MKPYPFSRGSESDGGVAAYESMLDLFTLLSFVLILAALVYVAKSAGGENISSVVVQNAKLGKGVPHAIPEDVLLVVLFQDGPRDKIGILDGTTGNLDTFVVANIDSQLAAYSSKFSSARRIEVGVKEPVTPGVLLNILKWLANNGYQNIDVAFGKR